MRVIYNKILELFPEVELDKEDIDLPYSLMHEVIFWLESKKVDCTNPDIIKRVIEFDSWCTNQERGKTAGDDILTIYCVSFYEELFENKKLQTLIKHISTREDIIHNEKYLISWVGESNYNSVLKEIN